MANLKKNLDQGIELKTQDLKCLMDKLVEKSKLEEDEQAKFLTYKLLYAIQGELLEMLDIENFFEGGSQNVN